MNIATSSSIPPDIFGSRYQIERELKNKRNKTTFLAQDVITDTLVVIKLLIFDRDFIWDDLKLFEREAETLKSLSHPAIPNYLDYLEIDREEIKGFALIQTYIPASSLAEQIESGRTFSEVEVKEIGRSLLEILEYLHSRQPTVIHRDIKPSNILLGDRSGNSVGQVYLIDFGSVQNLATKKTSTITIVGTYGYMPPEQFGGRVKPASDLYSLGATLIYLVTGEHPADLPETDLKIEFEEYCNLTPGFISWLKKITNPSLSSRLSPASKAIEELANCDNYQDKESKKFSRPPNSKILIKKNSNSIEFIFPPKKFSWKNKDSLIGILLFCLLPWFIVLLALLMGISIEEILASSDQYLIIVFTLTTVVINIVYRLLKPLLIVKKLKIDSSNIFLNKQIFNFKKDYIFVRPNNAVEKIEKNIVYKNNQIFSSLNIYFNNDKFELVNNHYYSITYQEIDWIAEELAVWLNINVTKTCIDRSLTERVDLYLQKAYDFHNQGDYQQAIEFYNLVLQFDPKSYNAYLYRASCYLDIGYYQGVVEDCYMALDIDSKSVAAYCTRGAAFCYLEDYYSANKDLNYAIDLDPKYQNAYYYLAAVNIALEHYQEAINICDRNLQIDNQYSYAYLMKAKAYLRLGDFQATIKNCELSLKINKDLLEAYFFKGSAYCYSGNYKKALDNFRYRILLERTANNYYNLAVTQFTLEAHSNALKNFNNCLKLEDKFKFAYYARANVYYELNNLELALEDFNQAVDLEKTIDDKQHLEDEHGYYARGLAKYHIGKDKSGAIPDIEKAIAIARKHQYKMLEEKAIALLNQLNS